MVATASLLLICLLLPLESSFSTQGPETGGIRAPGRTLQSDGVPSPAPTSFGFPSPVPVPTLVPGGFEPEPAPDNEEDEEVSQAVRIIISILVISVLGGICCFRQQGYDLVDNFVEGDANAEFREELESATWFVLPRGSISGLFARCSTFFQDKSIPSKRKVFFFSTRLKFRWNKWAAITQFILGWITFFTTLIGLFAPSNRGNSALGFAAMFLSEVVLHVWYGFSRYPNICSMILGVDPEVDDIFVDVSYVLGSLYNDGEENIPEEEGLLRVLGFFVSLVYQVASALGLIGALLAQCAIATLCAVAADDGNGNGRRRRNNNNDGDWDATAVVGLAAIAGIAFGSVLFPLLFLVANNPGWKVIAPIAHHIVSEYYEARLFHKSTRSFLISICTKFLTDVDDVVDDVVIGEGGVEMNHSENPDGSNDVVEGLQEQRHELSENMDAKDQKTKESDSHVGRRTLSSGEDQTETMSSGDHVEESEVNEDVEAGGESETHSNGDHEKDEEGVEVEMNVKK